MESIRIVDEGCYIKYINEKGLLHREDGPAYESSLFSEVTGCVKVWYINGKRHREDGPARIWSHINKEDELEYWLNDEYFTKEEWEEEIMKKKLERIKDL